MDSSPGESSRLTEAERGAAEQWRPMLNQVLTQASTRRILLLGVAICRRIWDRLPYDDCRCAVELVEQLADHPDVEGEDYSVAAAADAAAERLQEGYYRVHQADTGPRGAYLAALTCGGMWHDPNGSVEMTADAAAIAAAGDAEGPAWQAERRAQAGLLKELFRSPSRTMIHTPSWRTPAVVELARHIYEERAFDRLPSLADALGLAGCTDPEVLGHCLDNRTHFRGCWVVDLVLGKA